MSIKLLKNLAIAFCILAIVLAPISIFTANGLFLYISTGCIVVAAVFILLLFLKQRVMMKELKMMEESNGESTDSTGE